MTKKSILGKIATVAFVAFFSQFSLAQISTFPYSYDFQSEGSPSLSCTTVYPMLQSGWINDTGDQMDWVPDVNGTSSSPTGPAVDHTLGTSVGKYMYLETSSCNLKTSNLMTPTFNFTSALAPQVSFWYHMCGATMGSLFLEARVGAGAWTTLWTISGQQQATSAAPWLQAVVSATAFAGQNNVQFRFRGVTGTSFTSDMAIDDVLVENPLPNNAGVSALLSPITGMAAGPLSVDITLTNFGSNALNNVTIEWEVNGTPQPSVPFSGPAIAALGSANINLSPATVFTSGTTNLKLWTSNPNGVVDTDFGNDTLNATFCTGLSGTYTVGTVTSDFLTMADALSDLYNCGVGGPTILQVQPGIYPALVIDQPIPGISATNTVTWDGSNQTASISVSTGANVLLDGADYITIQNFLLNNTATSSAWGVQFTDAANYNKILNNRIQMMVTTSTTVVGIVASGSLTSTATSGDNANYNLIEGNVVIGGDRGISFYGSSTTTLYNSGNIIKNNEIYDNDTYGIYVYYQDSLEISGNYIHNLISLTHYGMYTYYLMNFDIIGNNVQVDDYGIYTNRSNSQIASARRGMIANNMIQSVNERAFYLFFTRGTDFYHNTLVSGNTPCYWTDMDNTVDVKNNIFVSTGMTSYAFQCATSTAFMGMDNNVFYVPTGNPSVISYSGLYSTLAAWQVTGTYGFDQNSLEGMPQFVSATDLHVEGNFLNDKGAVTSLTFDFDGEVRPAIGSIATDIGADEFTPPANDAGVLSLLSPTLPISGGFSSVQITVKNYGIADLASFSVQWEINGVAQMAVPYTGSPLPVNGTTDMILANINFPQNTTSLRFWTTMPNGMMDERVENDTLTINICPGLSGTYSVGHPTSDFATPAEAIDALLTCGVNGPVTMEFLSQTYLGPWVLTEIPGASATNTVTFDGISPTAATLSHNGTGLNTAATLVLDGVDYFIIKNFTIENTAVTNAYGVLFINEANYNTVEDNTIRVSMAVGTVNVAAILASASYNSMTGIVTEGNNANWNLIKGNEITGGVISIVLEGGQTDFENVGNQIVQNDIQNAVTNGIYVDEQDSLLISGNKISNITGAGSDAIMLFDIKNFAILANTVTSLDYGIAIMGASSDFCTNGLIANNMVSSGTAGEALYLNYVSTTNIYHNTFSGMPACYLSNHGNIDFRSNIMATTTSYCFQSTSSVSMTGMNNNLYYMSNPAGIAVRFGTTNYATLAIWQAAPIGYDANSVSGNPNFVSGLHIGNTLAVDTASTNLTIPIMTDIDGDPRPMGVRGDIGADERVIIASDVLVSGLVSPAGCGNAVHDVIVSIGNVGTSLMLSVPVTVNVTGATTTTFNATQPLILSGSTVNMNMGTLNTEAGGVYNFEIIVSAGIDGNRANDTLNVSVTILPSNQNALTMLGDTLVCDGLDARIEAMASYAPATIFWYDAPTGGNLIHTGTMFMTGNLSAPVTYYAEVQGCNSPRAMTTVSLDMLGINIDLGADQTVCGGLGAEIIPTITISPEVSIVWSDGSQSAFLEVYNSGQYFATVTNANGCVHTDSMMVAVSPMPTIVSNSLTNVSCGGTSDGAIDLGVTGGTGPFSYLWSTGAVTEDLSNVPGGSYNVTVYDNGTASNCAYVANYNITEPATLFVNLDAANVACNGTDGMVNITPTGGAGIYTFNWSTGATTEDLSNVGAGTYNVTVMDANGCNVTTSGTVLGTTPINVVVDTIFDEILQLGGEIHLTATGGTGTLQYVWNTGATTDDIMNLTAGTYSVTITDIATGCQVVLNGIVVVYKNPDFVNNIPSLNTFKLYPNPTTGKVWVNLELAALTTIQLDVYSVTGQLILSFEPRESLEQNYELDLSNYPSGVYMARFVIGQEVMTTKIIVE